MKITDKGIETGLIDSNGTSIKSGDTVIYQYKNGGMMWKDEQGEEKFTHVCPFDIIRDESHETVMEYIVGKDSAGFSLDLPKGINSIFFKDTVKYYVKNEQTA